MYLGCMPIFKSGCLFSCLLLLLIYFEYELLKRYLACQYFPITYLTFFFFFFFLPFDRYFPHFFHPLDPGKQHPTLCFLVLLLYILHLGENKQYLSLCVWLISLGVISSFIHFATICNQLLLSLKKEVNLIMCI